MNTLTDEQMETIAGVMFDVAFSAWSMNLEINDSEVLRDLYNPQVNDYVIETTNPFVPRLQAVGKLIEVIKEDGGSKTYRIERLDGNIQRWENARFAKVADSKTLEILKEMRQ